MRVTSHRESLAGSSLAVCENTSIVAVKNVRDDAESDFLEDCVLSGGGVDKRIKSENVPVGDLDGLGVP